MDKNEKLIEEFIERNKYEEKYYNLGYKIIAGVDEVGRGPLAGPVVVAAVVLNPDKKIYGLKDSKKLSKKKISELSEIIKKEALAYQIIEKSPLEIEMLGIKGAVLEGMKDSLEKLNLKVDVALIDYEKLDDLNMITESLTKGDNISNSIAAASIIAKEYRDKIMRELAEKHPKYGFATNVGYPTKEHLTALEKYGIIKEVHRRNYKPVRRYVEEE